MKTIWKIIVISIASGLALAVLGVSMGASMSGLYLGKSGVRIIGSDTARITEPDLESFRNINVDIDSGGVEFVSSGKYGIDIVGRGGSWDWRLEGGTLWIKNEQEPDSGTSFFAFNTDAGNNHVKIFIPPEAELKTVSLKTGSGGIKAGDFKADSMDINASYGNVDLRAVTSGSINIGIGSGEFTGIDLNSGNITYNGSYGDSRFENIKAAKFTADVGSGGVSLKSCRIGESDINCDYGEVIANALYSSKTDIFVNSGDVSVDGEFSGETSIRSNYGSIEFYTVKPKEDYSCDISTNFGSIVFDGEEFMGNISSVGGVSGDSLKIKASSGDIEVRFAP